MYDIAITKEMRIDEVIRAHPNPREIFAKHFGRGCLTCPGAQAESIWFGAMMHGIDADKIVQEVNKAAEKEAVPAERVP